DIADREARRVTAGDGYAHTAEHFDADQQARIAELAADYERDGAGFEILRLDELAQVYRAYEDALTARGALDFGEQIALVTRLFKERPNVLRSWQRRYRYILVDEFQDANVAQIELIELLGRTPDRPDNVMVVGDDDQSIYRFRGASFAAFAEFDARFSRPPAHAPEQPAPGTPRHLAIEQNFRSVRHVLDGANRLIKHNDTRFAPDKVLRTDREPGAPIELLVCAGPEDEAVAIVDAIRAATGNGTERPWGSVAILYRKHKHRDAIVERLRAEDIPYTVVGGLSLFETPEIRDLDQALRAIADPTNDPALVRMMTAGPWRLDALEVLAVMRDARTDRSHAVAAIKRIVERGERTETEAGDDKDRRTRTTTVPAETRARLRQLLAAIEELNPLTWREGPYSVLERYVELTATVLSLLAAGTLEAKRSVVNVASFLRFAADWQGANPVGTLADFVDYLDAYTAAGGELPTSVELSEDVEGVRLMTLYQAKGLEFPVVVVPNLLEGEWPTKEMGSGWFPRELLREQVPGGNLHTDEERRLLYVAMTRAQDRLLLSTHAGAAAKKGQSVFIGELLEEHGAELVVTDRTVAVAEADAVADAGDAADGLDDADEDDDAEARATSAALTAARRVMPLPTARERRLVLRLRAAELVGLMEAAAATDPEAADARAAYEARLVETGRAAAMSADEARAAGLDPLTFRTVALDTGAGANLLRVVPAPSGFSYTSLNTYTKCPLQFALRYVYKVPGPDKPKAFFSFGNTAHAAFEEFTRMRRERIARGEAPPTRAELGALFAAQWKLADFGDVATEAGYKRRAEGLLDNFWNAELSTVGEALHEELDFELVLVPDDGSAPVRIYGSIDRIDRLPSGGIEVLDYKTGNPKNQEKVAENLQLTIYALACRDGLGLGTPEKVTLYFTESAERRSTVRSEEELDAARELITGIVGRIRAGEFTASPGWPCQYCDYRAMCPERA
ncbi:MAG: ATP-dependent helicase, partial [Chloroflexi bacterium]|nr:ATP-dependent helicase [Chloroflexota bacterium]